MQGNRFTVSVHIHGTLAANALGEFLLPCNASLEAVSLSNDADSDMIFSCGTLADRDGFLAAKTGGDSNAPTLFSAADMNGELATAGETPHVLKAGGVAWDLDYDGSSGTAAEDVCIVFYFLEG